MIEVNPGKYFNGGELFANDISKARCYSRLEALTINRLAFNNEAILIKLNRKGKVVRYGLLKIKIS